MTEIIATRSQLSAALGKLTVTVDSASIVFFGDGISRVATGHLTEPAKHALGLTQLIEVEQKDTAPPAVVVATPTITDGLVLRWYRRIDVARYSDSAIVSASRQGVMLNGESFLHTIPAAWITDAQRACEMLRHDQRDRAMELATHQRARAFSGDLTEISR